MGPPNGEAGPLPRRSPATAEGPPTNTSALSVSGAGCSELHATRTYVHQLHSRRAVSRRLIILACGCNEIWPHRAECVHRDRPALSTNQIDAAHAAALHLLELGLPPLFDRDVLRALWHRDPDLAQLLHEFTGGD